MAIKREGTASFQMSLTDIADTVIPQCGFTADEIDTWVAKVEKISATVTGEVGRPDPDETDR